MDRMGMEISAILEWAGTQYLKPADPDLYRTYLLQIGGTDTFQHCDGTEGYWDRVQMILDTFFSSAERAEICGQILGHGGLGRPPGFHGFLARALAERRLQGVLRAAAIIQSTRRQIRSSADGRAP